MTHTLCGTPLDEGSAHRRYLLPDNTQHTHNRQLSMLPWWDSKKQSQQASGGRPTP